MTAIYWVRHAPVAAVGICYGQYDVPARGSPDEAAGLVLAQWHALALAAVPEVWSSPWSRTRQLAERVASALAAPMSIDPRLSELSFGEWEGRSYAELERDDTARFGHWMANYESEAPPGGETVARLRSRVAQWISERAETAPVLVFTHAGVIRSARALARNVAYRDVVSEAVPHLRVELHEARGFHQRH